MSGQVCPVHKLYGQTFSKAELAYFRDFHDQLKICKDCLYWIEHKLREVSKAEAQKVQNLTE